MILSMTGFSVITQEHEACSITAELRSVNHRYLDIQIKLPETLRDIESSIKTQLSKSFSRGKMECKISVAPKTSSAQHVCINEKLLDNLLQLQNNVLQKSSHVSHFNIADILRWPNIIELNHIDYHMFVPQVLSTLTAATEKLIDCRKKEGAFLKLNLQERCDSIANIVQKMPAEITASSDHYIKKIKTKLSDILVNTDDYRLQHEFAIFAQKIDIYEEIDRINAHLDEVHAILAQERNASGKKLDFLMQELNREANTICSKSVSITVTQMAVEVKVLIEQIREQVQNIE